MNRYAAALLAVLTLAGCEEEEREATVDPSITDRAQAACLEEGGQWLPRGASGANFCLRQTPDAGQACTTSSDCTSLCLARSRTCAPADPMFGCNDVIGRNGQVSTLCVE